MKAKRVDSNQKQIVTHLRQLGITVLHLHTVGKGCPDILLGYKNQNFLVELKDGNKSASKKKLTEDEREFFLEWKGQVNKCESLEDILKIIGL